jgi:iron complex transport system ATP-binding protein
MLGRHPHRSTFAPEAAADRVAVARALDAVALTGLAERTVETLSGGERQRAWIAMALAQEPALLLLDEPTTYLDLRHQVDLLALIQRLNRDAGLTIVAVLHDLNQALAIGDHAVLLRSGQVLATGAPSEVLNEINLREAFGLDIAVVRHPLAPLPYCVPRWTGA